MNTVPQGAQPTYSAVAAAPAVVGMDGVGLTRESSSNETIADMAITAGDVVSNLAIGTVAKNVAGPIGTVASAGFRAVGTSVQNGREMDQLLALYRNTVAAQAGIAPEQVDEQILRVAAERFPENKALREELERLDKRAVYEPVKALVTGAAAVGGGIVGAVGGGGVNVVTGLAASVAASTAADKMMDGVFGKEEATPFTALQQIEVKLREGQGASAFDLFLFHLAADKNLAAQIEGHMGDRFEELPEEKQVRAMSRDHPELLELCKFEAYLINTKALPPASLMDERMQQAVRQQFEQMRRPDMRIHTQGAEVLPMMQRPAQIIVPRPYAGNYARRVAQPPEASPPGQQL